jgi:hypothetical protein
MFMRRMSPQPPLHFGKRFWMREFLVGHRQFSLNATGSGATGV